MVDQARAAVIVDLLSGVGEERRGEMVGVLCAGDEELARQVRAALSAESLEEMEAALRARQTGQEVEKAVVGKGGTEEVVPGCQLLERLGEGGFGVVWAAEQVRPVRRRVAVKILKEGMDSRQVVARFEAERQALAMMDHPNIARVLDGGLTSRGRPYFVMELVRGVAITEYCEESRLSTRERIELMIPVCGAIQHAHQRGIIHRDIKPGNVLVTIVDGRAVPKVIDFGVAKAVAGAAVLTDKTVYTAFRQFIGTPAYMSPEQLLMSGVDVDTRSDVYALGVLLYELLSGSLPFDTESLLREGLERIQQVVREQEPPKPSTRVMTMEVGKRTSVAAARRLEGDKLGGVLRGEVDWMVMKAVEKDRSRRYQSPTELAEDLQRFLVGDAVKASPPSGWYRARKFVRRNRVVLTGVGSVVAALAVGMAGFAWQGRVASHQRDVAVLAQQAEAAERKKADAERVKAALIALFMSQTLEGAGPSVARGRDATMLKEMMRTAAERIERKDLASVPEAELRLRATIGNTYKAIAAYDEAQRMLGPAVELARRTYPGDHAETSSALINLCELLANRGDLRAAQPLAVEALEMNRRLYPKGAGSLVFALRTLSGITHLLGDIATAEQLARESLAMVRRLGPGQEVHLARCLGNLADILRNKGDRAGALECLREALENQQRLHKGDHPEIASLLTGLATICIDVHDLDGAEAYGAEAVAMYRRLFKEDHPSLAGALNGAGFMRGLRGDDVQAEQYYREALAMRKRLYRGDHPGIALDLSNLGEIAIRRGDLKGAEGLQRESLEMRRRLYPGDHIDTAFSLNAVGGVLRARGDLAGAEALVRECFAMRRRLYPPDHAILAVTLDNLGIILRDRGDLAGSETLALEALAMQRRTMGEYHPLTLISISSVANIHLQQKKYREVIATLAPVIDKARVAFPGSNAPRSIAMMVTLADARMLQAQEKADGTGWQEAEADYLRAHGEAVANLGKQSGRAADVGQRIASFYQRWDQADPGKGHDTEALKWRGTPPRPPATLPQPR